jgi:hypothetical protein
VAVNIYHTILTDHPRFLGSEHSVSSSAARVSGVSVFESMSLLNRHPQYLSRVTSYLQIPARLIVQCRMLDNTRLHTPAGQVLVHGQLRRPLGCKVLALWVSGSDMCRILEELEMDLAWRAPSGLEVVACVYDSNPNNQQSWHLAVQSRTSPSPYQDIMLSVLASNLQQRSRGKLAQGRF